MSRGHLVLLSSCILGTSAQPRQQFLVQPENQVVTLGDTITFSCTVSNLVGVVQWTRDGFGLGLGKALIGFSRYAIVGDERRGDWSLSISPVQLEDEADYQCQVGGTLSQAPIRSRKVRLTVKVAPQPPMILQVEPSGQMQVLSGRMLKLTCISRGAKPQAAITWMWEGGTQISEGVLTSAEQEGGSGGLFTTLSTLQIKVSENDAGSSLKCSAINGAENEEQLELANAVVTLDVRFAPVVTIRQLGLDNNSQGLVSEGSPLVLVCDAQGNPSAFTYSWTIDGAKLKGWRVEGDRATLAKAVRHLGGRKVSCRVSNGAGSASDHITLDVSYGPGSVSISGGKSGMEGSVLTLSCLVDSHPTATILWYKISQSKQEKGLGPNLTFSINRKSEGKYICEATTAGFPTASSEPVQVLLLRKPSISSGDQVFLSSPEETAHITCRAEMSPQMATVAWSYKGLELSSRGSKYDIIPSQSGSKAESKLVIKQTEEDDFGTYQCTATNSLGKDVALMELRQKGELSGGSLLLSCLLGVGLTISILAAVYCTRNHSGHGRFTPPNLPLNFFSRQEEQKTAPPKEVISNGDQIREVRGRSKEPSSPCSSEVFFEHFNKKNGMNGRGEDMYQTEHGQMPGANRGTTGRNGNGLYSSDACHGPPVCSHSSQPLVSTSLETKSCQTIAASEYPAVSQSPAVSEPVAKQTHPKPDVTQTNCSDGAAEKSDTSGQQSLEPKSRAYKKDTNGYKSSSRSYGNGYSTVGGGRRDRSGSRQSVPSAVSSSCLHQPAVNYYANSIYLSRELPPLYVPPQDPQYTMYGGQEQSQSLDYYTADQSWHNRIPEYSNLRQYSSECVDTNRQGEAPHLVPDYGGTPSVQSDYATWNYRRQHVAEPTSRERHTRSSLGRREHGRHITGFQAQAGHGASHV